eukprot:COSAG01_NODE_5772_length_4039_cov_18.092569_4_plen_179_part_00
MATSRLGLTAGGWLALSLCCRPGRERLTLHPEGIHCALCRGYHTRSAHNRQSFHPLPCRGGLEGPCCSALPPGRLHLGHRASSQAGNHSHRPRRHRLVEAQPPRRQPQSSGGWQRVPLPVRTPQHGRRGRLLQPRPIIRNAVLYILIKHTVQPLPSCTFLLKQTPERRQNLSRMTLFK